MKVLVTGAAGFLGTHVMERLLQEQHVPVALDNLEGEISPDVQRWYVRETRRQGRFEFYENDIAEYAPTLDLFREIQPDGVIHLAARHPGGRAAGLGDLFEVNVTGTLNVLEAARRTGIRRFILASSWEVYGDAEPPFDELSTPVRPKTRLGVTKAVAEHYARAYSRLFHMGVTVLRFFPLYGPRQRPDLPFAKVARARSRKQPGRLEEHPDSRLDFTFVEDAAEAIVKALEYSEEFAVFNVGTGRETRMADALKVLGKVFGEGGPITLYGKGVMRGYARTRRAKRALGFVARVDLNTGLKRYARWYAHLRPTVRMVK